jgi:hypothetical protein
LHAIHRLRTHDYGRKPARFSFKITDHKPGCSGSTVRTLAPNITWLEGVRVSGIDEKLGAKASKRRAKRLLRDHTW